MKLTKILWSILLTVLATGTLANDYLSALENDVLKEMNLARTNPGAYAGIIADYGKYYDGYLVTIPGQTTLRTNEGIQAVTEAEQALKAQQALSPFTASRGMSLAAKDHVEDQGPKGTTGHQGSDNSSMSDRLNRHGQWLKTIGENISYGANTGRDVVRQLLVDDGVPSRGHRKNLLNPDYKVTGIACGSHKTFRHMCVITYAGGYEDKAD